MKQLRWVWCWRRNIIWWVTAKRVQVYKILWKSLQPETANQLKFNFFPDIWGEYDKDFTSDTVQHPFPNGRRRREVKIDPLTGQKYESYEGEVEQIGDVPLSNLTTRDHIDEDDEFDDQFEEDLQDKKLMEEYFLQQPHVENEDEGDEVDFSSSRWDAYDALSSTLERWELQ